MMRIPILLAVLGIVLVTALPSSAQTHFDDCLDGTGNAFNATVVVPVESTPDVNGTPLSAGSEVAVFSSVHPGLCAGVVTWTGVNAAITVWGDDGDSSEIEGLVDGELMLYRVWDASTNTEYPDTNVTVSYAAGTARDTTGLYHNDAFYVLADLSVSGTAPPAPPAPTLLSPANGATGVSVSPTLSWNAVTGATSYRLQVDTEPGFAAPLVVDQSGLAGTSFAVSGLSHTTVYYWRARAANAAGNSPWSATFSFTTEAASTTPPDAPTLVSPSNGAAGVSINPTLTWNASPGADLYRLQLATDANFNNLVIGQNSLTGTSFAVSGLSHTTVYYWRVRAGNAAGNSPWSAVFSFTTEAEPVTPPDAPTLLSPADGAAEVPIDPILSWNAVSGADSYHLQLALATDIDFASPLADQGDLTGTSYNVLTSLDYATAYHWRVQAANTAGDSPWSAAFGFTTEAEPVTPPDAPTLASPADGAAEVSINPTLSWNAAARAASYRLQLATDAGFAGIVIDQSSLTGTSRNIGGLTYSTVYYWRVQAVNAIGESPWSATFSFTTEAEPITPPDAPTLASPADGAREVSINPTLSWNAAARAASYRLQLATDAGFTNVVVDQSGIASTSHGTPGLSHMTVYYWHVQAVNSAGDSPWSPTRHFTTENAFTDPPAMPRLLAPANGAGAVPLPASLVWSVSFGATSYRVQVFRSLGIANQLVLDSLGVTGNTLANVRLEASTTYRWQVRALNSTGPSPWSPLYEFTTRPTSTATETDETPPDDVVLHAGYPNPFRQQTTISFELSRATEVRLVVYDVQGKAVARLHTGWMPAGRHAVEWVAGELASGLYLCRLEAGGQARTQTLLLTR